MKENNWPLTLSGGNTLLLQESIVFHAGISLDRKSPFDFITIEREKANFLACFLSKSTGEIWKVRRRVFPCHLKILGRGLGGRLEVVT